MSSGIPPLPMDDDEDVKEPSLNEDEVDDDDGFTQLQEALGVTATGACRRHANCPVLFLRPENIKLVSCRVCFSEEKSIGIHQSTTFAAVVQELQKSSQNPMQVGSSSSLFQNSLSGGMDASEADEGDVTPLNGDTPASPASNMLHYLQNEAGAMERVLKRLNQVSNWRLRQKETEVLQLQLQLRRTQEQLVTEQATSRETIKALRRTIQQDLKIIKTMATQKQIQDDHEDAAPTSSISRSPPKRQATPHHLLGATATASAVYAGSSPSKRFSPSKSSSSSKADTIPEEEEAVTDAPGELVSQSSHYWKDSDLKTLKAATIFQSFRGGLLDIPKSPPAARHDRDDPNNAKPKKKAVTLTQSARDALKLRTLSRSNSSALGQGGQTTMKDQKKEIPLDILAAKLASLPVTQKKLSGHSPEQFFSEKVAKSDDLPQVPASPTQESLQEESVVTATHSILTLSTQQQADARTVNESATTAKEQEAVVEEETTKATTEDSAAEDGKFSFSVTAAECQDKFGDKGRYTGAILVTEGLPDGPGKMDYESGRIYEGEWKIGQWHGRGKLLNPNGDIYTGEFYLDARHGQGVYQWDNGDVYTGSFLSDKRHGAGHFSFHNGNWYKGEFCDGMFEGFGRYEFQGGYYEGDWKEGRYDGSGELQYGSGGKYTGEFRNSVAHGFGMEVMPDGRKRRGVWADGKPTEYFEGGNASGESTRPTPVPPTVPEQEESFA